MKDLVPNNKLVFEWPLNKAMPKIGDTHDVGVFGIAIVSAMQTGWTRGAQQPPKRYVEFEIVAGHLARAHNEKRGVASRHAPPRGSDGKRSPELL